MTIVFQYVTCRLMFWQKYNSYTCRFIFTILILSLPPPPLSLSPSPLPPLPSPLSPSPSLPPSLRMAQQFYGNVSTWMIQMESELRQPGMKLDAEITQRASLFMKVCVYMYCM